MDFNVGIKTIGNATLIAYDNVPILATDPWLNNDPAYFGSWILSYKIPDEELKNILDSKYIWFSHGHPDHLNHSSLKEKSVDDELPDENEDKPTKPDVLKKSPGIIIQESDLDDLL